MNQVRLLAVLVERNALRFTPAGVPVIEAQLQHRSEQVEAQLARTLEFTLPAIALGDAARQLAGEALGGTLQLEGFLATRSSRSKTILLHIQAYRRCEAPGTGAADGTD